MKKKEILDSYLQSNRVPEVILKKLTINSYLTDNFAYGALRIGNSIGDHLDISIEITLLDEIAKRFDLVLNTTEHAELHTKGAGEEDLDRLLRAAVLFENIRNNRKNYKNMLKKIDQDIRKEIRAIIEQ